MLNPATGTWGRPQLTINGAAVDFPAGLNAWCSGMFPDGTLRYSVGGASQGDSMVMLANGDIIMLNVAGTQFQRSVYNAGTRTWGAWTAAAAIPAAGDVHNAASRIRTSRTERAWP